MAQILSLLEAVAFLQMESNWDKKFARAQIQKVTRVNMQVNTKES